LLVSLLYLVVFRVFALLVLLGRAIVRRSVATASADSSTNTNLPREPTAHPTGQRLSAEEGHEWREPDGPPDVPRGRLLGGSC
jgi:hypothetical protein